MANLAKKSYKALAKATNKLADIVGNPVMLVGVLVVVAAWFIAGIFMQYDNVWFDILDVFVFLTTFFLVFIIQTSQNADIKAVQDKLDEIIDVLPKASKQKESEEKRFKRGD